MNKYISTKLNRVKIAIVEYNGHIYPATVPPPLHRLDLRLLVLAFRFDMTRFRVAFTWIRSIPTAHVTRVACPYKELAGRVCMQIQEHENALTVLSLVRRFGQKCLLND